MANKLRVNLMQCEARQASRVIYPRGIPLGWGRWITAGPQKRLMEIKSQKKEKRERNVKD